MENVLKIMSKEKQIEKWQQHVDYGNVKIIHTYREGTKQCGQGEGRNESGGRGANTNWASLAAHKKAACSSGDLDSIPGLGRSPEENGYPLHYSCLENPQGQRSPAGYSPRGHKEWDMSEQLSTYPLYRLDVFFSSITFLNKSRSEHSFFLTTHWSQYCYP